MLSELIPDKIRKRLYLVYTLLGATLGSIAQGFAAGDVTQPSWLTIAIQVFVYAGTAFGIVAAGNVAVKPTAPFSTDLNPAG